MTTSAATGTARLSFGAGRRSSPKPRSSKLQKHNSFFFLFLIFVLFFQRAPITGREKQIHHSWAAAFSNEKQSDSGSVYFEHVIKRIDPFIFRFAQRPATTAKREESNPKEKLRRVRSRVKKKTSVTYVLGGRWRRRPSRRNGRDRSRRATTIPRRCDPARPSPCQTENALRHR